MIIKVMSEDKVIRYEEDTPHILISIRSPGSEPVELPENFARKDTLRLAFHDVSEDHEGTYKWLTSHGVDVVPFTVSEARKVVSFLHQYNVPMLVINCEAGISRSAGMAAAISKHLTGDDSEFYNAEKYHPNELVKTLVLAELKKENKNG
jgi:predicted protein tyrosine phosphatase